MSAEGEQEKFWQGEFGEEYTERSSNIDYSDRPPFFARMLKDTGAASVCEFGCNYGNNLYALRQCRDDLDLNAVEINASAVAGVRANDPRVTITHSSIQQFQPGRTFDLTFSSGVLIHINPGDLPLVYDKLFAFSNEYVLLMEYYNISPEEIAYRGHREKMYKRDFAGEMLDRFPGQLELVDYGFFYHRVSVSLDDITWFLLRKTESASV